MVTGYSPYHWLIGQPPTWLLVTPHITGLYGNPPHGYWLLPISISSWENYERPLETIKDGWIGGEISFQSSQAWVCEMRKRLEELFKVVNSQEMIAKRKAKDLYDLNTQPRQLEPGELVLCHTPGLTSKLHVSGKGYLGRAI